LNIDGNITVFLNGFVGRNPALDGILVKALSDTSIFNALLPVVIIAGLWFSSGCRASRGRLVIGVCAVLAATVLSRALQISIPIHQRPLLAMPLNLAAGNHPFSRLSSFPSDHATLVFGLSTVILLRHRWLGLLSFAWMTVACALRIALGLHWPSDALGGLILGVGAVVLSQWIIRCPEWIWRFKELHRGVFYALMMIGAYETTTFFADITGLFGLFQ
jgi:undecaprenyl-diphosphatase